MKDKSIKFLSNLLDKGKRLFFRFPFAVTNTVFITVIYILLLYHEDNQVIAKLGMIGLIGYQVYLSISLFFESFKDKIKNYYFYITQGVATALLGTYYFLLPKDLEDTGTAFLVRYFFIMIAFGIFTYVAPFVRGKIQGKKVTSNAFWQFGKHFILRNWFSSLVAGILIFGVLGSLANLDSIFEWDLDDKVYQIGYILIAILFCGNLFYYLLPMDFQTLEKGSQKARFFNLLANALFLSLSLYFVVLVIYVFKLFIKDHEVSNGLLAGVVIFGYFTLFNSFVLFPLSKLKNTKKKALLISRITYAYMVPVVILLSKACWEQISEAGLNEIRILLVMHIFLFGFLAVWYVWKKKLDIRIIALSLAGVFLVYAFIATPLAKSSQVNRLEDLLKEHDILVDGKVKETDKDVDDEDIDEIKNILTVLDTQYKLENVIQDWFEDDLEDMDVMEGGGITQIFMFGNMKVNAVMQRMGLSESMFPFGGDFDFSEPDFSDEDSWDLNMNDDESSDVGDEDFWSDVDDGDEDDGAFNWNFNVNSVDTEVNYWSYEEDGLTVHTFTYDWDVIDTSGFNRVVSIDTFWRSVVTEVDDFKITYDDKSLSLIVQYESGEGATYKLKEIAEKLIPEGDNTKTQSLSREMVVDGRTSKLLISSFTVKTNKSGEINDVTMEGSLLVE